MLAGMKLTPEKLTAFCAALAETGIVARACGAVSIARQTAYEWREEIPEFAAAWDKALKIGVTALEDEAHRRAFLGVEKPLTHLGQFTYLHDLDAIDPETSQRFASHMAPVLKDANGDPRLATIKEYSDTLAIFLLKAHDPDKYRENSKLELAGSLALNSMSEEEIKAELAALLASGTLPLAEDVGDLL